jgi:hypothetical protein
LCDPQRRQLFFGAADKPAAICTAASDQVKDHQETKADRNALDDGNDIHFSCRCCKLGLDGLADYHDAVPFVSSSVDFVASLAMPVHLM